MNDHDGKNGANADPQQSGIRRVPASSHARALGIAVWRCDDPASTWCRPTLARDDFSSNGHPALDY
jgi:hypothetical protein